MFYCSRSCRAKDTGVGHGIKTGKFVPCSTCGKEIWRKGYHLKISKVFFCNMGCFAEFKRKQDYSSITGTKNYGWKGNGVGYGVLHKWVKRWKGVAKKCIKCGETKKVQWANKSHEYKRELDDWIELCYWCHRKFDSGENWGKATKKYNL